jgi:plastocyanin
MRTRKVLLAVLLVALTAGGTAGLALAKASQGDGPAPVNVSFTDYKFNGLKKNYKPGQYRFTFTNNGEFPHNLTVVSVAQGKKFKSRTIDPGQSQTLDVDLKPGSYIVACTVFNGFHISQGMIGRFTVGKINFDTGRWS